jgi:hypothetical protein
MVANRGSTSVVLLAVQKPVCRGEEADGWAVRASIVRDAACRVREISDVGVFMGLAAYGEHVFDAEANPVLHWTVCG